MQDVLSIDIQEGLIHQRSGTLVGSNTIDVVFACTIKVNCPHRVDVIRSRCGIHSRGTIRAERSTVSVLGDMDLTDAVERHQSVLHCLRGGIEGKSCGVLPMSTDCKSTPQREDARESTVCSQSGDSYSTRSGGHHSSRTTNIVELNKD